LGIPCVYYGSEQGLDARAAPSTQTDTSGRPGSAEFGAFRLRDRHVFNPGHRLYGEFGTVLAVRRREPALRRGRQFLREISGDGVSFGMPTAFGGGPSRSIVSWSRILAGREVVCAINTDPVGDAGPPGTWQPLGRRSGAQGVSA